MSARARITVEGHDYDARLDGEVVEVLVDDKSVCTGRWEDEHLVGCDDQLPVEAIEELEDVLKA